MTNQPYKVCAKCGQRCVLSMANCGRCGANQFQFQSSQAEPTIQANIKVCPQCRNTAYLEQAQCQHCGHGFRTQFQQPIDRTQLVSIATPLQPGQQRDSAMVPTQVFHPWAPNSIDDLPMRMIMAMWLSIAASIIGYGVAPAINQLGAVSGLVLAIMLVCHRNKTAKTNGWIAIGIYVLGLLNMAGAYMAISNQLQP